MNPAAGAVPAWVGHVLVPALNLLLALAVAGAIVAAVGEDPLRALGLLVSGALGYPEAISYTLYYATNFVLSGERPASMPSPARTSCMKGSHRAVSKVRLSAAWLPGSISISTIR